jgi:hypothetical protein
MTPYLGEVGKLVDFPDTYQRKYLHETVRNQTSRRLVLGLSEYVFTLADNLCILKVNIEHFIFSIYFFKNRFFVCFVVPLPPFKGQHTVLPLRDR